MRNQSARVTVSDPGEGNGVMGETGTVEGSESARQRGREGYRE